METVAMADWGYVPSTAAEVQSDLGISPDAVVSVETPGATGHTAGRNIGPIPVTTEKLPLAVIGIVVVAALSVPLMGHAFKAVRV